MHEYKTKGTCSKKINFDLQAGKLRSVAFEDGCDGNLKAISLLVEGMDVDEVVQKLKGVRCGSKETSCADQLAQGILQAIEKGR
jgi:uncharacterized protein (TIGR03905 family)